ncbi:MAG: MOSC N-terminal beta barrel domain-containing protein [Acidimicrobiales bacterium]
MYVTALWRYPVKSMQGEPCGELVLAAGGAAGDRKYGVLDVGSGTIVSAKRDGRLLQGSARLFDGTVLVTVPGHDEIPPGPTLDERLSEWLRRPVRLVAVGEYGRGTFECPEDFEDDGSQVVQWSGLDSSFVDESELLLIGSGDLAKLAAERPELQWDMRRFRPNVLVEAEAGTFGAVAASRAALVGEVALELQYGCTRCVMTTREQPGGIERQLDVFRHLLRAHDNILGVRARTTAAGIVRTGDVVTLG